MDRAAALVQRDVIRSREMTRRIPPPPSPPKQSVNIAIGRGSPPADHDQFRWKVVDLDGERLHEDDLTWAEAWKLKEQLAGGRKVVSPRIEQVEQAEPTGIPKGPQPIYPTNARKGIARGEDPPEEVVAASRADEELDAMLADMDGQ